MFYGKITTVKTIGVPAPKIAPAWILKTEDVTLSQANFVVLTIPAARAFATKGNGV